MNGWVERLRREVGRLGTLGVVGIGLLVFAAAFYFSSVRPGDRALAELRAEARDLERQLQMGGSLGTRAATPTEQLAAFYAFFPASGETSALLRRISAAAGARGLELQSGEYRMQRNQGARLARYEITLPLKGSYTQVRDFVADVLASVPAAVLEEVNLRRESVDSPRLDARVRFTVYVGAPG